MVRNGKSPNGGMMTTASGRAPGRAVLRDRRVGSRRKPSLPTTPLKSRQIRYLVNIPLFDPILTADRPSHWSAYLNGFFSPCEYKQLNLSAWSSPEKAHDWYVGNADHRSIVQAHRTGMLDTFSSMLATLSPKRGVRYDARCQECSLVNTNFPEQRRCNFCQAESPQMPLF
mmetsp:Transcript_2569/g.9370  ORF Transcript_2569/g.9370 Transcript_2569/m.9370 type:complete len:171 (-) Transcript_2569:197-709(-)